MPAAIPVCLAVSWAALTDSACAAYRLRRRLAIRVDWASARRRDHRQGRENGGQAHRADRRAPPGRRCHRRAPAPDRRRRDRGIGHGAGRHGAGNGRPDAGARTSGLLRVRRRPRRRPVRSERGGPLGVPRHGCFARPGFSTEFRTESGEPASGEVGSVVIRQSPGAGAWAAKGTRIALTVAPAGSGGSTPPPNAGGSTGSGAVPAPAGPGSTSATGAAEGGAGVGNAGASRSGGAAPAPVPPVPAPAPPAPAPQPPTAPAPAPAVTPRRPSRRRPGPPCRFRRFRDHRSVSSAASSVPSSRAAARLSSHA